MKDINGLRTLSMQEHIAIQQWYRITKLGSFILLLLFLLAHIMQWYTWRTNSILIKPICIHNEQTIQTQYKTCCSQKTDIQTSIQTWQKCINQLHALSNYIHFICSMSYPIESLIITKKNIECLICFPSIHDCMQYVDTWQKQQGITSALCSSITVHNKNTVLCTIQGTYVLHTEQKKYDTLQIQ
jgi:hypothetical protein